eukprot:TRINITY_DN1071_c0_g1_i1.p1 TRINITY_DN1071_c0_g1~~TRINITY_DN1071_c0_g1_i1.p1  ORF type:complete len:292 (+),score=48.46 TRINITY_DN1071_c0_g1_i1:142-1017(+)
MSQLKKKKPPLGRKKTRSKLFGNKKKKVFGVSIKELLIRDKTRRIPICITQMNDHVLKGLTEKNIFIKNVGKSEINQIIKDYNRSGSVSWKQYSTHTAATMIKQFLKDLPKPILSEHKHSFFENLSNDDVKDQLLVFKNGVDNFNKEEWHVLDVLFHLFNEVAKNKEFNGVSNNNLAKAVGPHLFHSYDDIDRSDAIEVTKIFIVQYEYLFTDGDLVLDGEGDQSDETPPEDTEFLVTRETLESPELLTEYIIEASVNMVFDNNFSKYDRDYHVNVSVVNYFKSYLISTDI